MAASKCEEQVPGLALPKQGARGLYALIIEMTEAQLLPVGRLGPQLMNAGVYVYVGSAMGDGSQSLYGRIQRHLSLRKRVRWHIDHILAAPDVAVRSVLFAEASKRLECQLVSKLRSSPSVTLPEPGLGASDCQAGCRSHLLLFSDLKVEEVEHTVYAAFKALNLPPVVSRDCLTGLDWSALEGSLG